MEDMGITGNRCSGVPPRPPRAPAPPTSCCPSRSPCRTSRFRQRLPQPQRRPPRLAHCAYSTPTTTDGRVSSSKSDSAGSCSAIRAVCACQRRRRLAAAEATRVIPVSSTEVAPKDTEVAPKIAPKDVGVAPKIAPKVDDVAPKDDESQKSAVKNIVADESVAKKCITLWIFLKEDPQRTITNAVERLSWSRRSIVSYIGISKQAKVLEHIGPYHGGVWKFLI